MIAMVEASIGDGPSVLVRTGVNRMCFWPAMVIIVGIVVWAIVRGRSPGA